MLFSFIQHRSISLMEIDSKGIYNVTKDQIYATILTLFIKEYYKCIMVSLKNPAQLFPTLMIVGNQHIEIIFLIITIMRH